LDDNIVVEKTFEVQEKPKGSWFTTGFEKIKGFFDQGKTVTNTKYNIEFTSEMMDRIHAGYIDEKILTFYCNYLAEKNRDLCKSIKTNYNCFLFAPSFYRNLDRDGFNSQKKTIRESFFFDYEKVLIPLYTSSNRCALAVINFGRRRLEYYDPCSSPNKSSDTNHEGNRILKNIQSNLILKSFTDGIGSKYEIPSRFSKIFANMKIYIVPRIDSNPGDLSGLLVCDFMRAVVTNLPFNNSKIISIRNQMQREIMDTLQKSK